MNHIPVFPTSASNALFVDFRMLMTGKDSVSLRVEGSTPGSMVLALTSLTGDLDDTATALCEAMLRECDLDGNSNLGDAIDKWMHVDFDPLLVGHLSVEVASNDQAEAVTLIVTTTSLGAMVGAVFVHFAGAVDRVRDAFQCGLTDDTTHGIVMTTNIRVGSYMEPQPEQLSPLPIRSP